MQNVDKWLVVSSLLAAPVLVSLGFCAYYRDLVPLYFILVNFTAPTILGVSVIFGAARLLSRFGLLKNRNTHAQPGPEPNSGA